MAEPPGAAAEDSWGKVDTAYGDNGLDSALLGDCARKGSVVSRANSIGSTSASSVPNTDDEDSDYHQEPYKESYKDQRRRAHTQAEQKRRDAIKKGYDDLQAIVPTCQQQDFSIGSQKLSKAIVLQKTIDYIQFLHKEKKKQEEEVSILRKEVMALKIMKVNYEQIVKAHQDNPNEGKDQISDQMKFNVFQGVMDSLFQSFNASISVTSFQELSACVFSWIEEHCKPQVSTGTGWSRRGFSSPNGSMIVRSHLQLPGWLGAGSWPLKTVQEGSCSFPVLKTPKNLLGVKKPLRGVRHAGRAGPCRAEALQPRTTEG
uniref:Max-like protein X n=1 Tax=Anas zonorhyncha TaxID=75864 RepID=A0A8B9V7P8_9AVES